MASAILDYLSGKRRRFFAGPPGEATIDAAAPRPLPALRTPMVPEPVPGVGSTALSSPMKTAEVLSVSKSPAAPKVPFTKNLSLAPLMVPAFAAPTDVWSRNLASALGTLWPTSRGRGPADIQPGESPAAYRDRSALLSNSEAQSVLSPPVDGNSAGALDPRNPQTSNKALKWYLANRDSGPNSDARARIVSAVAQPWLDTFRKSGVLGMVAKPFTDTNSDLSFAAKTAAPVVTSALAGQQAGNFVRNVLSPRTSQNLVQPSAAPAPDVQIASDTTRALQTPAPQTPAGATPGYRVRTLPEAVAQARINASGNPADNQALHDANIRKMILTRGGMAPANSDYRRQRTQLLAGEAQQRQDAAARAERIALTAEAAQGAAAAAAADAAGRQADQQAKTLQERQKAYGEALSKLLADGRPATDPKGRLMTGRDGKLAGSVPWNLQNPSDVEAYNSQARTLAQGFGLEPQAGQSQMSPMTAAAILQRFRSLSPQDQASKRNDPNLIAAMQLMGVAG